MRLNYAFSINGRRCIRIHPHNLLMAFHLSMLAFIIWRCQEEGGPACTGEECQRKCQELWVRCAGARGVPCADAGAAEGLRAAAPGARAAAGLPHFAGEAAGAAAAAKDSKFERGRDRGVEGRGRREGEPLGGRGGVARRKGDASETSEVCRRVCEFAVSRRSVA